MRDVPVPVRTRGSGVSIKEEGTTYLDEVARSLEQYDGSKERIVIEVEYKRVGGVTPAAARCIGVVFAAFGSMPIGTVAVRFIADTDVWSQHSHTATPSTSWSRATYTAAWRSSSMRTVAA